MKTAKLVIGILSIVLFVLVGMQSCVAGLGNTMSNNGEMGGTAGLLVAICLLVAGIVAICTRKGGKGGLAAAGFYLVGGVVGLLGAGSYGDLYVWSVLSIAFGVVCLVGSRKAS